MTTRRMPSLVIDEVLLLVDTYFQLQKLSSGDVKRIVAQKLSDNMRSLPFFPEYRENPAFRSFSGMQMCLANVSYLDPAKTTKFGHGSALQRRVFEYYIGKQELLHGIATAIISVKDLSFPLLEEYRDYIGGQLLPSYHIHLEKTAQEVKRFTEMLPANNKTKCGLCKADLETVYGETAEAIMETHIAKELSEHTVSMKIALSDMIHVCPNCHKRLHISPESFSITTLA